MEKIILTGIKPTGQPHLGNYTGAIRPALNRAALSGTTSYLFIADYHSLTSVQDKSLLKQMVYEVTAAWLACGLNPLATCIYRQSDIPELFELNWILSCLTPKGLMNRGHSYKALVQAAGDQKNPDAKINMGVFNYPILMSADILLFGADEVPVSQDQKQHLEITKNIASKFNRVFKTSLLKEPQITVSGTLLPGNDGRKMSKSYGNYIPLFCTKEELKKHIMKIKTNSQPPEEAKDPEDSILFSLYKAFATGEKTKQLQLKYQTGVGWGEVKQLLHQELEKQLSEKRKLYNHYIKNPGQMDQILREGAKKARPIAQKFMEKIRKAIGIS